MEKFESHAPPDKEIPSVVPHDVEERTGKVCVATVRDFHEILVVRQECLHDPECKTPNGISHLKPLNGAKLRWLVENGAMLIKKDVNMRVVATCFYERLKGHPLTATISGLAVAKSARGNGLAIDMVDGALEKIDEEFPYAFGITASPWVAAKFEERGAVIAGPEYAPSLEEARVRYEQDAHLVKAFVFPLNKLRKKKLLR